MVRDAATAMIFFPYLFAVWTEDFRVFNRVADALQNCRLASIRCAQDQNSEKGTFLTEIKNIFGIHQQREWVLEKEKEGKPVMRRLGMNDKAGLGSVSILIATDGDDKVDSSCLSIGYSPTWRCATHTPLGSFGTTSRQSNRNLRSHI